MSSFLESVNLFPYKQMWRVKSKTQISHPSAGCASLLLIFIILLISIMKVVQVFQKSTVFISTQTDINLEPSYTTLSTFQNSSAYEPFMFAFSKLSNSNKQVMSVSITVQHINAVKRKDGTKTQTKSNITLQPCTVQHFSKVPNITHAFQNYGVDLWKCFPINQSYTIGGSQNFGESFQYIAINFDCSDSDCETSKNQNIIYDTYTLNTFVNPSNGSKPASRYFSTKGVVFQSKTSAQYFINLDENVLITDNSVLPFQSLTTEKSLETSETVEAFVVASDIPRTQIFLQSSGKTLTFRRKFLKLLDAIAVVGGLFPVLLGSFFFMGSFGKYVYDMKFSEYYFKSKQATSSGFFSFVKQSVYNILSGLNFKLDWKVQGKRQELTKTIQNMLDIVYLLERIQFLQKGMSMLLKKHQWKALHLAFKPTLQTSEQNYKAFELRTKFEQYLAQSDKKQLLQSPKILSKQKNGKLKIAKNVASPDSSSISRTGKEDQKKALGEDKLSFSAQNLQKLNHQDKVIQKQTDSYHNKPNNQKSNIQRVERTVDFSIPQQQDYDALLQEITSDVGRLIREAENRNGDRLSRKILQSFDPQAQQKLVKIVEQGTKKKFYYVNPFLQT